MRYLLIVAFCIGGLSISIAASASDSEGKQTQLKQHEAKGDSPILPKACMSPIVAMDVLTEELSGSFVEVSEFDVILFLREARSPASLCDTLSRGFKPDLNTVEPTCGGNIIMQIL